MPLAASILVLPIVLSASASDILALPPSSAAVHQLLLDQADGIADVLIQQGAFREVEPLSQLIVAARSQDPLSSPIARAASAVDLAQALAALGQTGEAKQLFSRSIDQFRRSRAASIAKMVAALQGLGEMLREEGDLDAAEKLHQESYDICRAAFGPDDPRTAVSDVFLACIYCRQGRTDGVHRLEQAVDRVRRASGEDHADYAWALGRFGAVAADPTPDRARVLLRSAIDLERRLRREKHLDLADDLYALGCVELQFTSAEAAEPLLLEALGIDLERHGPDHLDTARTQGALGEALTRLKRFSEAEPLLRSSYDTLLQKLPPVGPEVSNAHQRLVDFFDAAGRHDEAELYRTHP